MNEAWLADQRYIDDVDVGEEFERTQQFDEDHIERYYAANSGLSPAARAPRDGRYTDIATARRNGLERPMVPGPMSQSMAMQMLTEWMGPLGRLRTIDVSFRRPVLRDSTMRCVILVTDTDEDGLVSLDLTVENEQGERAVLGTATLQLPRRD